jgi:hypothetical protein
VKASGGFDPLVEWRVHVALWVARAASRVSGDFVECGVNAGFTSSAILESLTTLQKFRFIAEMLEKLRNEDHPGIAISTKVVLRQEHRAGEKMFVDYAGATIPIHDPQSGEVHAAAVFVAVLGASSYTFAEATTGQDLRNWIGSHQRAFEFFGGVSEVVVPDFVPGHKIRLLWRSALCGLKRGEPHRLRVDAVIWGTYPYSELSHFSRSAFCRHPAAGRHSAEESTGGRHAATAACFVRNVISA